MMPISFLNREIPSFHAAALILGAAAFLSKLLGLLRDRLLASRFGAGDELDVYYAAFQIPDLLFTVLLVGAASAAVLPVIVDYERRGPKAAEDFLLNLLTVFSLSALVLAGAAMVLAPQLVPLAAPGFGGEKLAAVIRLTRWMVMNVVFLGLAGILSAFLQARRRFLVFALPPIAYNLGIIIGVLALVPLFGLMGLAYGVLAGGALQVLVQVPALKAMGLRLRPRLSLDDPGLVRVARVALPRVAALIMSQLTLVVLAAVASLFTSGSLSVFRLATNLLYVPVGLFGVSWALAVFPKLSGDFLAGRGEPFRQHLALGIRSILFWAMPSLALFIVLRAQIVRVALGSGAFDWEDTRLVAAVLAVLAVAVVSESILPLILRAFYALGRTAEPLVWDIVGSASSVLLAFGWAALFTAAPEALAAMARVLRIGDIREPHILAVALAFSLGSLINAGFLALALRRAARRQLGVTLSFEANAILTMLGASVLAGLAAYGSLLPFPALLATNTLPGIFLQGAVAGAVGLAVYALALLWQGNAEIQGIVQSFRERLLSPRRTPSVFEAEKLDGEGTK